MTPVSNYELLIRIDERVRKFDEKLEAHITATNLRLAIQDKRLDDLPQWRHFAAISITLLGAVIGGAIKILGGH